MLGCGEREIVRQISWNSSVMRTSSIDCELILNFDPDCLFNGRNLEMNSYHRYYKNAVAVLAH